MIHSLLYIVVVCLVAAVLLWGIKEIGLSDPLARIARVAIVVVVIILIIGVVAGVVDRAIVYPLYPSP